MSLADLMVRERIISVKPSSSVKEVARIMYENGVGSVIVEDDKGRLIGIFTERDLVKVVAKNEDLNRPVGEFMTKNVFTLRPTDSMWKALDIMIDLGIRHVPVVDDSGRVVGVVSMRDILSRLRLSEG